MLLAQLHHKVPSEFEGMEDVLTSSVFGLFKYLPDEIAHAYLAEWATIPLLGGSLQIDLWPRYPTPLGFRRPRDMADEDEDAPSRGDTEPDVLITTNEWVILVEAKYRSALDHQFDQLGREFAVGHKLAREAKRRFRLLVVTGHTLQPSPSGVDLVAGLSRALQAASAGLGDASSNMIADVQDSLRWTNWQRLHGILSRACRDQSISNSTRSLVEDVCSLLELRGLKPYDARAIVAAVERWEKAAIRDALAFLQFDYSYQLPSLRPVVWEQLLLMDLAGLRPPAWHPQFSVSAYDLGTHLGRLEIDSLRRPEWCPDYLARRQR